MVGSDDIVDEESDGVPSMIDGEIRKEREDFPYKNLTSDTLNDVTSNLHFGNRQTSISCLQFDRDGDFTRRKISKAEILAIARKTSALPDPRTIARYLGTSTKDERLDQLVEELGLGGDTTGKKKVLRRYLRTTLQARDLRQVDPAFPQKPAIWVRQSAIVISLEQVRSIIFHDLLFLFDPDNHVVKRCSQFIQETLHSTSVDDAFLPFEFRALEGILIFVTTTLEVEFAAVSQEVQKSIGEPGSALTTRYLEEMRLDKQKLSHYISRANAVQDVLSDLLDDDDDMANMYLTEKHRNPGTPRNPLDHDEAEMLLESYLQVMDDLTNKAQLLNQEIADSEDVVSIHLDTLRNKLIMMQLLQSIVSLAVAMGGTVAGLFGMNLELPIFESEYSRWWFLGATVLILGLLFFVPLVLIFWLRKKKLYTSPRR